MTYAKQESCSFFLNFERKFYLYSSCCKKLRYVGMFPSHSYVEAVRHQCSSLIVVVMLKVPAHSTDVGFFFSLAQLVRILGRDAQFSFCALHPIKLSYCQKFKH